MASNLLTRGEVFAGRYRIGRSIGAGGMGAVFEAEHVETERRVALKVLLPQSLISDTARDRFKQEARVAGKIQHPNIVQVLDAGVDDDSKMPYLVMELLHGEDLASRIERFGPMTPGEALPLLAQVASALECLHQRSIIHRDLKPENLFLTWSEDGSPEVKLLDFGVAKVLAEGKTSALTQDAQGTPVYMAPEQFAHMIRISAATDIYALGMVAFTLLAGRHYWTSEVERGMNVFMLARITEAGPKEAATARATRYGASLPLAFDEWFAITTAVTPGERYPTATDAIDALADLLQIPSCLPSTVRRPYPENADTLRPDAPLAEETPDTAKSKATVVSPLQVRPRNPLEITPNVAGTPRDPVEAKPSIPPEVTPPIPLSRAYPFWRRPTTMTVMILGFSCVLAFALLALRTPTPPAEGPASSAFAGAAFSELAPSETAPRVEPMPSADVSATAASSPSQTASTSESGSTTTSEDATSSTSAEPASSSAPLPPVVVPRLPLPKKKPKYTRE